MEGIKEITDFQDVGFKPGTVLSLFTASKPRGEPTSNMRPLSDFFYGGGRYVRTAELKQHLDNGGGVMYIDTECSAEDWVKRFLESVKK